MEEWTDAEVTGATGYRLMRIRCGAQEMTLDRDDVLDLLAKMQATVGKMACQPRSYAFNNGQAHGKASAAPMVQEESKP
jgi:hypothetical protein